ncbi:multiple sugar transport system permease protein [Treponema bryantii]|uniref:Multiple sugar transport system permease protein n=1 Tax=Treponema bryantii TaxID=163 RepID=A0A1I3J3R4_9SPIR|nr:sugar ABC transporter permease [Treponema bryantii]SFI54902.1 multiple sugar transport system permease protein [Treponema bryantii]
MKYSPERHNRFNKIEPWLYLAPFLIFIIIFTLYPVINVFTISFKENYSYLRGTFKALNFENYKYVLTDDKFISGLKNTALYVLFVVPISTAISLFFANLLNKKVRGSAVFQTAFFLPMVTSVTAVGLIWRLMYNQQYGIINWVLSKFGIEKIGWVTESKWSLLALIIFGIWNILPFTIIILLSGMQNINEMYYTVARVDGAKPMRIFFKITVPLLSPTIFLVCIVNTISCFKVFSELYPLFYGKPGPYYNLYTVVYYIRYAMMEKRKYGYAAAAAVILFLCIFVVTLLELHLKKRMGRKGLK